MQGYVEGTVSLVLVDKGNGNGDVNVNVNTKRIITICLLIIVLNVAEFSVFPGLLHCTAAAVQVTVQRDRSLTLWQKIQTSL
jgi:hypothetical protein